MKDYFPLKLALGEQFFNRKEETALLVRNIDMTRHTVLISPRRYGKSSLVNHVVAGTGLPFASMNFFLVYDDLAVTKRLLAGISTVVSEIMPLTQQALQNLQRYFSGFKLSITPISFSIEASFNAGKIDAVDVVYDALNALAKLAKDQNQKVILFMDEFQDIQNAENAQAIQGAIRHVAQEAEYVVCLFSGSNRKLLLQIFDDKTKPLYMLCDKLFLDRMFASEHSLYIQAAAREHWGASLDEPTLLRIFTLTEMHPFYINMLCHELWKAEAPPQVPKVVNAWSACLEMEQRRIDAEISSLTLNQQKVLSHFARTPTIEVTSRETLHSVQLSSSSLLAALKNLMDKDMVYTVKHEDPLLSQLKKGEYRVLDPLLSYSLRKTV